MRYTAMVAPTARVLRLTGSGPAQVLFNSDATQPTRSSTLARLRRARAATAENSKVGGRRGG